MELQVGVKIILQNKQGKYLLLERNPEKYPEVKRYDSLDIVGGRMKAGSTLLANLKREVFEETQLVLEDEPKLVAAQDILRPEKHVVRLTYWARIEGEPVLNDDHVAYQWLSRDEVLGQAMLDQYFREVFTNIILK